MPETHPSKDIIGSKSRLLKGRNIALCVTGSVAAVKCPEIARELMRQGAEVYTVMSSMAQKIIHPYLMEWATGNHVVTELTGKIEHVMLVGEGPDKADLVLVAPATANTISKIACGIDDTTVTSLVSTAFGSGTPIMIVPAMHESMYRHPVVTENIRKLQSLGVEFVGPRIEEGKAKMAETKEIVEAVIRKLTVKKDLAKRKVLVTAGPTLEHIDPVRVITNKSSGKMGVAVVEEALSRGAEVTLVYGPGTAVPPKEAKEISVVTSQEMYEAVVSELKSKKYDIAIAVAAVADWTPEEQYEYKVPTSTEPELTVKLKPTPKIIDAVKKISPDTFLVAFRAEYNLSDEELVQSAYERLKKAKADLIAANDTERKGTGFGYDANEVFIVDANKKVVHVPLAKKREVAKHLFDVIVDKIRQSKT
ncbi:MAG: bifunctional phosphopantothenoylcysteine decarboxylase/phosphopantothenate synthase [Candidatus Bathyarchaeota archaeon BA2]|nr:MAG: bifunctional phosphopantothenoylcysteine decarboxylase/phosphopantothenate synthase [Candidatus Bathyarchaeota archaeon BA2]